MRVRTTAPAASTSAAGCRLLYSIKAGARKAGRPAGTHDQPCAGGCLTCKWQRCHMAGRQVVGLSGVRPHLCAGRCPPGTGQKGSTARTCCSPRQPSCCRCQATRPWYPRPEGRGGRGDVRTVEATASQQHEGSSGQWGSGAWGSGSGPRAVGHGQWALGQRGSGT
jgi:hypothetical protein